MKLFLVVTVVGCAGSTAPAPPARVVPVSVATPPPSVAIPPPPVASVAAVPAPLSLSVAWAKTAEASPNYIDAVAVRADGSILVAGPDDGRGWSGKRPRGRSTASGAVVSLAADGTTQWVRTLGSAEIHAIAALPDGGAIACGGYSGTLRIDGKLRAKAKGKHDLLVLALDPAGKVTWTFGAGGSQYNTCNDVAVTPEGHIVMVGAFTGATQLGELAMRAVGGSDAFVAELDASGTPRWVATGGGREDDDARSIAIAGSAIYVTGRFGGAATFGDTHLTLPAGTARKVANPSNLYVARYGPNGDLAWATSYGVAESFDSGWAVTGLSDGGAAVVGEVAGHAVVARYSPTGHQLWAHSTNNDSAARAVIALPDDDLLVAAYWGWPQGGHDLSLVGTTHTITLTAQGSDTALARYSASGELLAAARIAGATPHGADERDGSEVEIHDIARTPTGRLVLAGRLWGSALFDAGGLLTPTDLRVAVPGEHGSMVIALDPAP